MPIFKEYVVERPGVVCIDGFRMSTYDYTHTNLEVIDDKVIVRPVTKSVEFQVATRIPKTGLMMVGIGGNNGTTLLSALLAHKHGLTWRERSGTKDAAFFGSVTQSCAISLGKLGKKEAFIPFSSILPMASPDELVVSGWDISSMNLYDSIVRGRVLQPELCDKLRPFLEGIVPLPSIYDSEFIASSQSARANNVLVGTKREMLDIVRGQIRKFKADNGLDTVVVLWTGTTERFCEVSTGVHDTWDNFLAALDAGNDAEISPSSLYAAASLLERSPYLNGSPQNTFVPALIELATTLGVPFGGDDFKSGQTKMKSHLSSFLVDAGIPIRSIASYNHLGNNDGLNLRSERQFRSKEKSKGGVIDDIINSNPVLYPYGAHGTEHTETAAPAREDGDPYHPIDHVVVIKYVPEVGDSKRALDEYTSEILLHGINTISLVNVCEDSLLAAPLMLDLVILAELFSRIKIRTDPDTAFVPMNPLMSNLGYYFKAPIGRRPDRSDVINALSRQRQNLENFLRAVAGLPTEDNVRLEHRLPSWE